MDEIDNLLKHLGIYDDFDLLGQSWGGKACVLRFSVEFKPRDICRNARGTVRSIANPEGLETPHYCEFPRLDGSL